jgi:hypothetical protein
MTTNLLKQRIQERIDKDLKAIENLHQMAEEAKANNDYEKYFALLSPTELPMLHTLLGQDEKAKNTYAKYMQYYQEVRDYEKKHQSNKPMLLSRIEGLSFLLSGNKEYARDIFYRLAQNSDRENATKYGILLIESGAKDEGESLLRERVELLKKSTNNLQYYPLAECYFWLGLQEESLAACQIAVDQHDASAPMYAFHTFLKAHYNTSDVLLREGAVKKLYEAIEYFYDNAFLDQAVDAYHYKSMVTSQSSETVIQGMTISW